MSTSISGIGVRTVYSTTNVGLVNWVVLVASLPYMTNGISSFDSSGQVMEIGTCLATDTANSELRQMLIPPGGGVADLKIPMGYRLSIRAVSGAVSTGENDTNVIF